jgi:FtsP/CotA-like multicopper oxidase with cupredoxin domain
VARVLALRLEGHPLVQIAQDGTHLPAPVRRDHVVLPPGGRADVLVTPNGTGRFALVTDPYDRGTLGMMGGGSRTTGPVTLATLVCGGAPAPTPTLPATLPAEPSPPAATVERTITFQMGMGGMGGGETGMAFTIDGRAFDPDRTDQTVTAGTTEDWTVRNSGPLAHPFHLHAWPFTVLATSDAAPCRRAAGRCPRPTRRLGPPADPVHPPHRPQRLSLPHPRPRRPRHDGHRRRPPGPRLALTRGR